MTQLSDFTAIRFRDSDPPGQNDHGTTLNPYVIDAAQALTIPFSTAGLTHDANGNQVDAVITMMVRGLFFGTEQDALDGTAEVRVASPNTPANGRLIGRLQPFGTGDTADSPGKRQRRLWRQVQFWVLTNTLGGGNNDNALILGRVSSGGVFDRYEIANIVCHFHQEG